MTLADAVFFLYTECMIRLIPLVLVIAVMTSCAVHSQKNSDVIRIEFTSISRGGYSKHFIFTADSVVLSTSEGRGAPLQTTKRVIDTNEWTRLVNSLKEVSLTEIPDLPSPTMKRAHDGARHSALTLITTKGSEVIHSFDDEDPHQKLQVLMKEIKKLSSQ